MAGDFSGAARELREALQLQEAALGSSHPDLADTLNNLGVACEKAQQPDDAEQCYRRALAIATANFPPDHPFVATSRANLREFCEANGRPLEKPAPPKPAPKPAPKPTPIASAPPPRPAPPPAPAPEPAVAAASGPSPALILIGAAVLIVVVIVIVLALRGRSNPTAAPDTVRTAAPPAASPQATTPQPPAPAPASAPPPGSPSVVGPRLCRSLDTSDGEWNCERAASPVRAGALIFLTRVKSARDTTVQHRWYRGQELVRSAQLKVAANPTEGYRTYSRYFVTAGPEWRVELRTSDGVLLHEEKFAVK